MKHFDYIIVGLGIGGVCLAQRLLNAGKRICVFDTATLNATSVAAGVVNPVVLKRINAVWRAKFFLEEATTFYSELEQDLGISFKQELGLLRVFSSVEEQNNWFSATDRADLKPLLDPGILANENKQIWAKHGFGRVSHAFRLDTMLLLSAFTGKLADLGQYRNEPFDHQQLRLRHAEVAYKDITARQIVFSEGVQHLKNPLYKGDWLIPKKGEYVTFRAPDLKLDHMLKGPYFLVPLGDDLYQAGATFAHGDNSPNTTIQGRKKLSEAISKMINCPFEIVGQTAGLRPTVKDRRPVLGAINGNKETLLLNGFGTRGILMAPLLSSWLLDHSEKGINLPPEVDIKRFLE